MPRHQQVVRQWRLLRRLERAVDGVSVAELADDMEANPRSVYRDLEALQEAGFPIYNDGGRWFLTDSWRRRGGVPLGLSTVLALRCARSTLEVFAETPLFEGFEELLASLDALLTPEMRAFARQLDDVFVGDPFGRPEYSHAAELDALRAAVAEGRSVKLRYRAQSGETTERLVDPYQFWFHRSVLYLVGHCHLREQVRMFSMARVVDLSPTDQRFDPDPDFDFESFRRARFRTWAEGDPVTVRIQFAPEAANYVAERKWHSSQKLQEVGDGWIELEMETSGLTELTTWVLSFGERARVVEPKELVERVRGELLGALGRYGC